MLQVDNGLSKLSALVNVLIFLYTCIYVVHFFCIIIDIIYR